MKSLGHLPVLIAIVLCLVYLAVPAPRADAPEAQAPVVEPEIAAPEPIPDPKFGSASPIARGPLWQPEGFEVRLEIPAGWTAHERRGRPYLSRDIELPRQGNFNLLSLPNFFGKDLDGLLEENRRELEDNPQFTLDQSAKIRLGGREVLRIDYRGTPRDDGTELHFVCVMYRDGRNNVALTLTVNEAVWPEIAEQVERSLASLQFE